MATIKKHAVVIGAGTGGYPCAIRLGQLGVDAMLVEKDKPGGVCLNWGCIPSKALISATKLAHKASHASKMGLKFEQPEVDMKIMQGWKSGIIKKLTGGVKSLVKGNGCEYVTATAEFLDPHRLKLTYPGNKADDIGDIIVVADVGHVEGGVLICWGCCFVVTSETGSLRVTGCRVILSQ